MPTFGGGGGGGAGGPYNVAVPPGEQTNAPILPANPTGGLPLALLLAMLHSQQGGDLTARGGPASMSPDRPLFGPSGSNPISGALSGFLDARAPGYSQRVRDAYAAKRNASAWGDYNSRMGVGSPSGPFTPSSALGQAYATPADVRNPLSPNYDANQAQGSQFAANVASGREASTSHMNMIDALINIMLEQGQNPAMGTGQ